MSGRAEKRSQVEALFGAGRGTVHMVGIGGVGMAGLACHLNAAGFRVTGCDAAPGPLTAWLSRLGIPVTSGHSPDHLADEPTWVIRSPAVTMEHPELAEARQRGIPVHERGMVLPVLMDAYSASIAVAGAHGKTTTSSMILHMLEECLRPVSYAIGGIPYGRAGAAGVADSPVMVAEADESDGTLELYRPSVAVVMSTELDHVDHFRSPDDLAAMYRTFAGSARRLLVCPVSDRERLASPSRTCRTFAIDDQASAVAFDLTAGANGIAFRCRVDDMSPFDVQLSIGGTHNVLNALAAFLAVESLGVHPRRAARSLAGFRLPGRRFDVTARDRGVTVISDYAHHPTEIRYLLEQARACGPRRMIGVFQPHRYSRTRHFRDAFAAVLAGLDQLHLVPVYSASEPFVEGGTSRDLFAACEAAGVGTELHESLEEAWDRIRVDLGEGDMLLVIGAGDVERIAGWAKAMLDGSRVGG